MTCLQKNIVALKNVASSENSASPPSLPQLLKSSPQIHIFFSPSFCQGRSAFYALFEKAQYNIIAYSIIYKLYQKQQN